MKAFFGGQINEEFRGDLAIVVNSNKNEIKYNVFGYKITDEEFLYLTGVGSVQDKMPIKRVYVGVSNGALVETVKSLEGKTSPEALDQVDRLIVRPYFIF